MMSLLERISEPQTHSNVERASCNCEALSTGETPVSQGPLPGSAIIELSRVAGSTVISRAFARSPLKLLTPRTRSGAAWIVTSTYGGGLLGGDSIDIELVAGADTRTLLSTQASTKIYRTDGPTSRQILNVNLEPNAILVSALDPIVCFAGSRFEQRQQFILAPGASLVAVDWLTSGRHACGERWAFDRYENRTEIYSGDRCIFRDKLRLDPIEGPLASPMRMGLFDCYATVVIVGRAVEKQASELLRFIASQPAARDTPLLFAASAIEGGALIRVAGIETESVGRWLRQRLAFVVDLLGEDPWSRKW